MAALKAELEIAERHEHQLAVDYAEKGLDSSVSYGGYDLKIKNTKGFPISFVVVQGKNEIFVDVVQK